MYRTCLRRTGLVGGVSARVQSFHTSRSVYDTGHTGSPIPHSLQDTQRNATKSQSFGVPGLSPPRPRRLVVGITGATGGVVAIRILQILQRLGIETHLVISKWGLSTLKYETPLSEAEIRGLASVCYTAKDLSANIASGSFQHDGMIIVPCSMKTLAAIRAGFCDDLISRAADVTLKEDRKLLLAVRETPLNDIHLDNMLFLRRAGAVIFPPVPAFYTRPRDIDDLIDQTAGRMLDSMGIFTEGFPRWEGFQRGSGSAVKAGAFSMQQIS